MNGNETNLLWRESAIKNSTHKIATRIARNFPLGARVRAYTVGRHACYYKLMHRESLSHKLFTVLVVIDLRITA